VLTGPLPAGLCLAHRELARRYLVNDYNPRRPSEWPGGSPILDARTDHAERARDWDEKNRAAIDRIAAACRSGRSSQCTPPAPAVLLPATSSNTAEPAA
jgi:hypothetical protein